MEVPVNYPIRPIDPSFLVTPEIPPEPVLNKKKKKKKKNWEEDEEDLKRKCCGLTIRSWVLSVVWIISLILLIGYLFVVITNVITQDPQTVKTKDILNSQYMPAVTICNWNTEGEFPNFAPNCSFCRVSIVSCFYADFPCNETITSRVIEDVVYTDEGATFHCMQFNFKSSTPLETTNVGYDGLISWLFELDAPPLDKPNARTGIQVTFHRNDQIPNVFAETNFVQGNTEGSYSITETKTVFENASDDTPAKLSYDVSFSSIGLAGADLNATADKVRVKVAFSFSTLDRDVLTIKYIYTTANVLGNLSGIIGLLIGLDLIKFARGLIALTKFKAKGIRPFVNVWNS